MQDARTLSSYTVSARIRLWQRITISKLFLTWQSVLMYPIGLSDHTLDNATAVAATALGACMVEKHFTLCRDDQGPDDSFSLEPQELKKLCKDVKVAWSAIGQVNYELKPGEKDTVKLRRSLYVVQNIRNGEIFTKENVRSIRPGLGLPPKYLDEILGKTASCDIAYGTPLDWSMVKNISS